MKWRPKYWLSINKIYFEISQVALLSVMAIIVSYNSMKIADSSYRLNKAKSMPLFKAEASLIRNDSSKNYENEILAVSNEGEKIKSYAFTITTFLKVQKSYDDRGESKTLMIPINDYYLYQFKSDLSVGKLITAYSIGGNYKVYQLIPESLRLQEKNEMYFFDLITLIKLRYEDIQGEKNAAYLNADPLESSEITPAYYDSLVTSSKIIFKEKTFLINKLKFGNIREIMNKY